MPPFDLLRSEQDLTHNINLHGDKKLNSNFAGSKTERDRRGPGHDREDRKMRVRKKATLTEARLEKMIKIKAQGHCKSNTTFNKKSYLHRKDTGRDPLPELQSMGLTEKPDAKYSVLEHQTIAPDPPHWTPRNYTAGLDIARQTTFDKFKSVQSG